MQLGGVRRERRWYRRMIVSMSWRDIGSYMRSFERCPQASSPEEIVDRPFQPSEGDVQHGRADDEHKIPAWCNAGIGEPDRLARTPLRAVAVMRLAKLLADDETTAGPAGSISCGVQGEPWMRPCFSFSTHTSKLLRAAEPLVTPHSGGPESGVGSRESGARSQGPEPRIRI